MYAQKRIVSVTLDIECYEDLDLQNINWVDILGLEGDENIDISIKETADLYQCASLWNRPLNEHRAAKSCIVVLVEKFAPKMINNDTLEMLTSREQLMEDIDAIVDGELSGIISQELSDELVRRLCDAVCRNFPTK